MAGASNTIFAKMTNQVFPRMPDFYCMIMKQSQLAVQTAAMLEEYIRTSTQSRAVQIAEMNDDATELREKNMGILKKSIATPIDREDIFRAFTTVDTIIPWADRIISEINSMEIPIDDSLIEIIGQLRSAAESLHAGYQKLASHPADADNDAEAVLNACATLHKQCRAATTRLFQCETILKELKEKKKDAESNAMAYVLDIFKHREIFRLLHDAGNAMSKSGKVLHDIVVQVA